MKGKMVSSKTMEKQRKKTMASTRIDGKAMEKLRDWTMMKKWRKTMEKTLEKLRL